MSRRLTARLRSAGQRVTGTVTRSLRAQVIVGLAVTLVAATGVTLLIDERITDTRLRAQAEDLLADNLSVAAGLVTDERARLQTVLRNNAQSLQVLGAGTVLTDAQLRREASAIQRNLGTEGVVLAGDDGSVRSAVGLAPASLPVLVGNGEVATAQLVPGPEGTVLEVVWVALGDGSNLVSVRPFGDARAFELRRLLSGNQVVLLHDGEVLGSTLADSTPILEAAQTPGRSAGVIVDGQPALVGFTAVAPGTLVGVVTPQLLTGLGRDLASGRIIALLVLLLMVLLIGDRLIRLITRPLTQLADTAEAIGQGDDTRVFTVDSDDEIGRLGQTLESMRQTLRDQMSVISLQAETIRTATQRIVTARDVERRRMAQDLHDGVQQQLVMLRLRIGTVDSTATEAERQALGREVEAVIQRLREASQAIYPAILSDRGLAGAVYSLVASSPLPVTVDLAPDPVPRMPEAVEAAAYFIIAEATTNALKHADAGRLIIRVRCRGCDRERGERSVLLVVADDGQGFDDVAEAAGTGLQNLRDRASALGGVAHVRSVPGIGTAVVVRIPLDARLVGGALQEEEHGGDAAVEVVGIAQAELAEDGVGVLLDRPLADDELLRDP